MPDERRHLVLQREQQAFDVGVEDMVVIGFRLRGDRGQLAFHAGVVHRHVEPAEVL
jgi:hypothetical protein